MSRESIGRWLRVQLCGIEAKKWLEKEEQIKTMSRAMCVLARAYITLLASELAHQWTVECVLFGCSGAFLLGGQSAAGHLRCSSLNMLSFNAFMPTRTRRWYGVGRGQAVRQVSPLSWAHLLTVCQFVLAPVETQVFLLRRWRRSVSDCPCSQCWCATFLCSCSRNVSRK